MHYDFCNEQSLRTRAFELFSSRNAASRSWRTHRHRARELISKIGTIENGDYYYDQNDDQPIPLESDQIVVLMGGMDRRCRALCFRAFHVHAFRENDEGWPRFSDRSRSPNCLVGDAGR